MHELNLSGKILTWLRNSVFLKLFCPVLVYKRDFESDNEESFRHKIVTDGTGINSIIKSITGVLAASIISYLMYLYIQIEFKLDNVHMVPLITAIFVIFATGLSRNNPKFRCITLLIIPYMATNRGRTAILMNTVALSSQHVVPNVFKNLEQLHSSFICNKQMLEEQLVKSSKQNQNYKEMKATINEIQKTSDRILKRLNDTKNSMNRGINNIKKAALDLKTLTELCSDTVTNPNYMCTKIVSYMIKNCQVKFLNMGFVCSLLDMLKYGCNAVISSVKATCQATKAMLNNLTGSLGGIDIPDWDKYINITIDSFIDEFKFEIEEEAITENIFEQNKTFKEVGKEIAHVYEERLRQFESNFGKMKFLFPVSMLFILLSSCIYLNKYLKYDHYKNRVITPKLYELDEKRLEKD